MAGFYFCNLFTGYYKIESELINLGFWGEFKGSLYSEIIAMALALFTGLAVNSTFNRNEFREKNTYLPALLVLVTASFFESFYYLDGLSVAILLLALSIIQVFRLSQNEDGRRRVFNASFLFGLASTFYPALIICFPFLFWMIWVIRPFVFRESALAITGYLIPLIYAGTYSLFMQSRLEGNQFSPTPTFENREMLVAFTVIIVALMLFSIGPLLHKLRQSSIRLKKLFRILFLLFVAMNAIILIELIFMNKLGASMLLIIPFAFILPYGFGDRELKRIPTAIFYLLMIISVGKFFIPLNF